MSPIGKIFVVLNLVFSLVLLGVVGAILAKGEDFRQSLADAQTKYDTDTSKLNEELKLVQNQNQALQRDKAGLEGKLSEVEVQLSTARGEVESLKVDLAKATENVSKFEADLRALTTTHQEALNHTQQLVTSNQEMIQQRNEAADAQRAAEEDAARARAEIARLNDALEQLRSQVESLEAERGDLSAQIQAAVQSGFDISKVRAFPKIDGVVQSVNSELGLVVLSVGRDDGVQRGMTFDVYGNGQYKGKVVVDDVFPDNSAARILPNHSGRAIQAMDKATTRL